MTANPEYYEPNSDDTQEIDIVALYNMEAQDDLLDSARANGLLAFSIQKRMSDLSQRGEPVPAYMLQKQNEAAVAAEEQLTLRSRLAQQEYRRTNPSPVKRLARWLGSIANIQR